MIALFGFALAHIKIHPSSESPCIGNNSAMYEQLRSVLVAASLITEGSDVKPALGHAQNASCHVA